MTNCIDPKIGAWVDDYCLNELTGQEEAQFEQHMYDCAFCRREVIEAGRLIRVMRQHGQPPKESLLFRWRPLGKLAVATALILIAAALFTPYIIRPTYFQLATVAEERVLVFRGAADRPDAVQLYNQGDYRKAQEALETYLKSNPQDYEALYLSALCSLHLADRSFLGIGYGFARAETRKAVDYFERALALAANDYAREDCYWHLGKAYLRLGDKIQAEAYFQKILGLEQKGLMRKEPARQLLAALQAP